WDSKQVANWLAENGFADANALFIQHEITGDILLDLNYNFLRDIGVASVGERAKILALIKKL
ncbi:sterile alpha motif/pointed domain-containing protein, partial [Globomyces pollinis-pini]